MARGLTLDSGALIAAEKRARQFWAIWKEALSRGSQITVPATVLSQAWRGSNPVVARVLHACEIEVHDEARAKAVGVLLARSRTSDIVDASVVVGAAARGDAIVTSDPDDIARLVAAARTSVRILVV